MARAQGARAQMALAYETVYGTPPVSGFRLMPFARTTLGSEQPLLNSELLGYGRDPLAPIKDAVTADGDVMVPIDAEAFGFWLKAAFGDPTTMGAAAPYTHTFHSGSWALPSMSIETGMPEVPRYAMYSGCVLDQLSWQVQRSGLLTATARLVAQGETIATTTSAETPTELGLQRFSHFNGAISRNGSALGDPSHSASESASMSDITSHLLLPYILASQAQKHVTHNEALRLLDAMVQLSVLDRTRTAPPASPTDGDRHIVASGAIGLWSGWDLNVAFWVDGVWMRLVPRPGWLAWIATEQMFLVWNGSAWQPVGEPVDVPDSVFSLVNTADPTKRALFTLSGISTGTTRTFTLPNTSSELAILAGTQTFSGNKTFSGTLTASGTVTVSAASASIGTATGTATYGLGSGATTNGTTKTVNIGTGGANGSTTVVNIGSATAGAGGTTVINTPNVTFANTVTQVGMPQANLTAQLLGLGGATADSYNRLSINTPAMLFNHAGNGIEATFNKNAPGNDAASAFKTGFSARALIRLLGNDDFSFKVSPDGSTFFDAIRIDRTSGRVELPEPLVIPALSAAPDPPPAGKLAVYARDRAGAGWLDVQRPSGRAFPLQPHFGVNRVATWAPSSGTTVNSNGMPRTVVGTVATPTLATTNLSTSIRRWRVTSAATVDAAAQERSAGWVCWRGNADGLGGWSYVNRLSLTTLQATGMGFFGLYGSTSALATTLTLATVLNCIGIGFQRGTHTNWQLVHNHGSGAPTLIDLGASFPVASMINVLTLYIAAAPNGTDIGVRVVEEVSGAAVEFTITTDMPAATQLLGPRNYMNTGATAAAVAYDCSGVYVETDY